MEIKKGILQSYEYTNHFDDEGIEYRKFQLTIDGKKFVSKGPKNLYLEQDVPIVYEVSGTEILSGFLPQQAIQWGKNARKLKRRTGADERYKFIQGKVLEKRKEVSSSVDFTKDFQERRIGYTIVLEDETHFNAAYLFGKPVKPGMEIAAVLMEKSAVMLLDKTKGKLYGRQRPWFVVFALLLIAFTPGMYYVQQTKPDFLVNFNTMLIVINVFLVLALLLSIVTFIKGQSTQKFLYSQLRNH